MFCNYGNELNDKKTVILDKNFLNNVMPYMMGDCLKVYLYGLYKCQLKDNTIEDFAEELQMTEKDVKELFYALEDMQLISIRSEDPFEVIFISQKNATRYKENANKSKYTQFTLKVQNYFEGARQIDPNEYTEYYNFMEVYKVEPDALLKIISYCIEYKGKHVSYPYILAVAKNWAYAGIHTVNAVEEKITQLACTKEKLLDILKALGLKRSATLDESQLYLKWTETFGFTYLTIMSVAYSQKKKGGTQRLDDLLTKYFELHLFSENEIKAFEENRNRVFTLAKDVCKAIGKYYEVYDNVVDTYIIPWNNKGYDDKTIMLIANMCFKSSIRTLEGMDDYIQKFYKLGIISESSLLQYLEDIKVKDEKIYKIFELLGLTKKVRQTERAMYDIWTKEWKLDDELIKYSINLSIGKDNPIMYMNKILSNYHENKIFNMEDLKSNEKFYVLNQNTNKGYQNLEITNYTQEEIISMMDNLKDVKI